MASSQYAALIPQDFPAAIQPVLQDFLDAKVGAISVVGSAAEEAARRLQAFVLDGGKRVRPLYAWAGFIGAGGLEGPEDPTAVLRAAASLELIQACALIHDDIIDQSATRRGRPSLHKAVEEAHRQAGWRGDAARYGEAAAILVGDLAAFWADDLFFGAGLSAAALERARPAWEGLRTEVLGGQLLDITVEATGAEDPALPATVNRFKTAAYTIERPLHLGAALAGADAATIAAFRGYGRDIGIAFQLRDDMLGLFEDSAVTGKPTGDDLRQGKRTLLLALALQDLDATDPLAAGELRAAVGTVTDEEEVRRLTALVAGTSAPQQIEEKIDALVARGLGHLEEADLHAQVVRLLRDLAISSTQRRS